MRVLIFVLAVAAAIGLRAAERPPNVVIIFADDMGYGDIGPFGAQRYATPNLDELARGGRRFTSFYVAQPVCSASRAALLTGCYPNRVGIQGALGPSAKVGINAEETTLAELVKQKNYATAIFGKWHLGHLPEFLPGRHGFDEYYGLPYSNDMWPFHPEARKGTYPDLPLIEGDEIVERNPDQRKLTGEYTRRAVSFIEKNKERPFFLYLAHSMPHVPLFVGENFERSGAGLYADVIREIDWSVGEVMRALRESGVDNKTLVIFTSDNGPWLSYGEHAGSAGPLREGKGTVWEGGVRVPCIVSWPGKIPAGTECDEAAMTIDLFPTVAGLTGAKLPERKIDGRDIWPLMAGAERLNPEHPYFFYYNANDLLAVRKGDWKFYVPQEYRSLAGKPGGTNGIPAAYQQLKTELALFNLRSDAGEKRNVAAEHPEVVKELEGLLAEMRKDLGDARTREQGAGRRAPGRAGQTVSAVPTAEQERELLKEVKVPEGFEAEIFAVPPAVNYPVFVAAAADGTLYVSSDRNGSIDRGPNRGRVLRVRDVDGDGHAEEVKAFVGNVDSPRGLVWDRDRLYLLHPPHLSAFIDRDGDGLAEEQQILVKNIAFTFKDRPADHSSNGVKLGVDGWIYCAIGDFGFMEAVGRDGRKLQLRAGGVVRVRPDGSGLELYARGTRNILEACVSPLLDIFARDNTNDGDGWDIRLHHFTGLSEHGYPSLYKNFEGEFIEPLADYGGGSGCGGMYLSEPGFPEGYGEALYTADWGREWVYRHRLTPKGATFQADQSEFVRAPRVTDLDADALGRIYVASWKGATFTYAGENVGFVVRVTPKEYRVEALPDFRKASEEELIATLESASHKRRLEAQRELLARELKDMEAVERMAADSAKPLASRVAAMYLLKLKQGAGSHELLASLLENGSMRPFAIRALCEDVGGDVPVEKIAAAVRSNDARARREAAFGLSRVGGKTAIAAVASLLGDEDPVVRHTAVQALKKLGADEACFRVLDSPGSSELERDGAKQVLQALHRPSVVEGLLARLRTGQPESRRLVITALARLHQREGEWKGDSWGTRPDTSGPYYQPEGWEESTRIAGALKEELKGAAGEEAVFIARELGRHKISDGEILGTMIDLAEKDDSLRAIALAQLARADETANALPFLLEAARKESGSARAHAVMALAKINDPEAAEGMIAAMAGMSKERGREGSQARQAFLRSKHAPEFVGIYAAEAVKLEGGRSAWADAALLSISASKNFPEEKRAAAKAEIDRGWVEPERRAQILRAIALAEHRPSRERVLESLENPDPRIAAAAKEAARALRLDRELKKKAEETLVGELPPVEVLGSVAKMSGDRKLGEELFVRQACNTCHTVEAGEPLRGPFLGNIGTIYKRDELAAAILVPNKTVAQGFAAHRFELKDGNEIEGFVVQESADRIIVRNIAAQEITIRASEVSNRAKLEKSLMPEGLAAGLTVRELASLVDYLQGLAAESK